MSILSSQAGFLFRMSPTFASVNASRSVLGVAMVESHASFSSTAVSEAGYKLKSRSAAKKRFRPKNGGKAIVHGKKGGKEPRTNTLTRQMFSRVLPYL